MVYLFTVTVATLLIALGNFLFSGDLRISVFGIRLLTTVLGVAAVFLIDAIAAFVSRRLPEKWFSPEARAFDVGKREKDFYRKTKINAWKKYVPEWGCFTGFHKDKMQSSVDSAYLGRFLIESNYGVAGHLAGALLGFLILLIPGLPALSVALPIAIVNFVLSVLPTMILRFNTPALRRLYRRSVEKESSKDPKKEPMLK